MRRLNQRKVTLAKKPGAISRKAEVINNNPVNRNSGGVQSVYSIMNRLNGRGRICVIRSVGGLGDILMTMPCVKQLRHEFPEAYITYATDRHSTPTDTYYHLVKNAPFINEIVDARFINKGHFDAVVDLSSVCIRHENSNLPLINRIDIFSRACGLPRLIDPVPFYSVEPHEDAYAVNLLKPYSDYKLVMLHTASFDAKRSWPVYRQRELIELFEKQSSNVKVLVSDFNNVLSDKSRFSNVVDVTQSDIRMLAAVINRVDTFVGPDSGPMHIAGALRKRSFVLFGSMPPSCRINHYKFHTGVIAKPKLSCMHCVYKLCDINFKCMKDITGEQVFSLVDNYLNRRT